MVRYECGIGAPIGRENKSMGFCLICYFSSVRINNVHRILTAELGVYITEVPLVIDVTSSAHALTTNSEATSPDKGSSWMIMIPEYLTKESL